MKLRRGTLAFVLLAGALFAPNAVAQKPVKEPVVSEPLEFGAGEVCAFPTRLETVASNMSSKTFPDGRMLVTGRSTERVTNLASGESIDLRTGGSALFTPLPNGSLRILLRGRALIYLLPQDVGGPALLLARGRVAEVLDTTTNIITSFRLRGKRLDVCAQVS